MSEGDQGVTPEESQNQNTEGTGGQAAAGQEGDQTVPVAALQRERQARQAEQQKRENMEQRLQTMEQQNSGGQKQQQSNDPLEGLDDDEPLTASQVRQIREQDQARTQAAMAEIQMRQKFPDYDDVIKNYLPQKIQENPSLQNAFNPNDPNDMVKAYELGKEAKQRGTSQSGGQQDSSEQSELEATLEQNQNKPGSASQAASSTQSPPSGTERVNEMARKSPGELDEEIRKAKRGEI